MFAEFSPAHNNSAVDCPFVARIIAQNVPKIADYVRTTRAHNVFPIIRAYLEPEAIQFFRAFLDWWHPPYLHVYNGPLIPKCNQ